MTPRESYKKGYDRIDWSKPITHERKRREPNKARGNFPLPMMIKSFSDPVQSMADGKWYSNPNDLRRSYRAENNPAGVDYIELGNEDVTYAPEPEQTRGELKDEIRRAIHMVENEGWKPESVHLDDV